MKKGFTLVEMLIVVVVLVTLMTITFRLTSLGRDQTDRNKTIARLQRLENALSGYYAAFGSYPPVKLHGSRDIYASVNEYGIQSDDQQNMSIWGWTKIGDTEEKLAWEQVQAACKSQPVDCRYPYPAEPVYNDLIKSVSEALRKKAESAKSGLSESRRQVLSQGFDNGVTDNIGRHDPSKSDWRDVQLFKYGLLSYLLPRYLVMMNSEERLYSNQYAQWKVANTLPSNPMTGSKSTAMGGDTWNWYSVRRYSREHTDNPRHYAQVANIPSQAVTARWMPNFEGIVCCQHDYKLYGINIRGDAWASDLDPKNTDIQVYRPGGYDGGGGQAYVLDGVTVLDGWRHEFFYYSLPPHQSYTLWSAGPNGRTFPPWISRSSLDSKANKCVGLWVEDDIVRMSN